MLQCCYCSKKFKYESERKRHEQSHDPQFECKECSKKFSFLSALKRHEKQHERTGNVKCSDCGKKFRDSTLLKRHIKYAHKGTYICSKCNATFNSDVALSLHQKSHKPRTERRFQCSYEGCTKSFNYTHHLKHHELTHINAKQHYCNICGKGRLKMKKCLPGFIQYHHFKSHIRSHTPDVWLPCTVPGCNKQFAMEYALKRHLLNHKEMSNSALSSDSNCGVPHDIKDKEEPDVILCTSCGDLVQLSLYDIHSEQCKANSDAPQDLTTKIKDFTLNNNNYMGIEINSPKGVLDEFIESNHDNLFEIKSEVDEIYNSMVKSGNMNAFKPLSEQISRNSNQYTDNNEVTACEGCDCSTKVCNSQTNDTPQIEYRSNGTIKLKDVSLDSDIADIRKGEVKLENKDIYYNKFVPYNSCKSILGKCIVSGNGTISEECLCAKMALDEQPMMEQEIDEITPRPIISTG